MEGSGFDLPLQSKKSEIRDQMIHQLYVSLGSMGGGNSSTKLRKHVSTLLDKLLQLGGINNFQAHKIFNDFIYRGEKNDVPPAA